MSFTMGNNTPLADLMVGHLETGKQCWVDVKGLSEKNAWNFGDKDDCPKLLYVLVLVGKTYRQDRFFILSQQEVKDEIDRFYKAYPKQKRNGTAVGFKFDYAEQYEGKWDTIAATVS